MYKRIVVGTDGSASANIAVDAAIELARLTGATLQVVHAHKVMTSYASAVAIEAGNATVDVVALNDAIHAEARRICDHAVERAERVGVPAESHCVPGDAADALLKVVRGTDGDLLVVGNRGMSGVRRFVLGSVPNTLSHHCASNLLIVDTARART